MVKESLTAELGQKKKRPTREKRDAKEELYAV